MQAGRRTNQRLMVLNQYNFVLQQKQYPIIWSISRLYPVYTKNLKLGRVCKCKRREPASVFVSSLRKFWPSDLFFVTGQCVAIRTATEDLNTTQYVLLQRLSNITSSLTTRHAVSLMQRCCVVGCNKGGTNLAPPDAILETNTSQPRNKQGKWCPGCISRNKTARKTVHTRHLFTVLSSQNVTFRKLVLEPLKHLIFTTNACEDGAGEQFC